MRFTDWTVNIVFPFKEGPWGGGNQFLKALREKFKQRGIYNESPRAADVILFNSHHLLREVATLKLRFPHKLFVHRIDGPTSLIRGSDMKVDNCIYYVNDRIADVSLFQSQFCERKNCELGMTPRGLRQVIYNAPDATIFNQRGKRPFGSGKVRIISTSWSRNKRKGFDVYQYLDQNLDFNKYEYLFVGNSDYQFGNIKLIEAVDSAKLAQYLKDSDLYITASRNDPCSNALIEAICCGLVCLAYNDGGHPELVGNDKLLFNRAEEIPRMLEEVTAHYHSYYGHHPKYEMDNVAQEYIDAINEVLHQIADGRYRPRRIGLRTLYDVYRMRI